MNRGQRQVIAEKVSSTVRVLELLGLEYRVGPPKRQKEKGNKSPRVVTAVIATGSEVRIYNGIKGNTWAYRDSGRPVASVKSVEDLYIYLRDQK